MRAGAHRGRRAEGGAALLVFLAVLLAGVLYGLLWGLNEATATAPLQRSQQNAEVLRQAKEALIAYAVQRPDPAGMPFGGHGPGHFPCPDRNNDGLADGAACGTPATRVGRLPWRSLGLPDLRDAAGERLWYAVSRCFLERPLGTELATCPNGYRVNSDVPGALTIAGNSPAQGIVAIVFAPGAAVGGQSRSGPGPDPRTAPCDPATDPSCQAASYLEAANSVPDDLFVSATGCEGGDPAKCPLGAFNDQLVVVSHEDVFRAAEEEVRLRLSRDILPQLNDYWARWRSALGLPATAVLMPFAAPFVDAGDNPNRPLSLYRGRAGETVGLLPLTRDDEALNRFITWDRLTVVVETREPPGAGAWLPASLASPLSPDPLVDLNVVVSHDGLTRQYRVQARLRNVGLTFARPVETPPPVAPISAVGLSQAFEANGDLTVTYTVTVTGAPVGSLALATPRTNSFSPLAPKLGTVSGLTRIGSIVSVPLPLHGFAVGDTVRLSGGSGADTPYNGTWVVTAAPSTNEFRFDIGAATPPTTSSSTFRVESPWPWLFENNWYRHVMYVVSPGVTPAPPPGFVGACVAPPATPPCVVVNSGRPAEARNDARFALVLAGRNVRPVARSTLPWDPPATPTWAAGMPSEYFEGANATLAEAALAGTGVPRVLEQRLRSPAFNDKVIAR